MAEEESQRSNNIGCVLFAFAAIGIFLGVAFWLGKRDDAAKTPCERYAEVAYRVLYNCHSGLPKEVDHHTAICERALDPTPACLERLESLTCDELRSPPEIATGEACARK